jgi:hypothetical protein
MGVLPMQAAPMPNGPAQASDSKLPVVNVQSSTDQILRRQQRQRDARDVRRDDRQYNRDRRDARNNRDGYYRGYRGSRHHRPGYRRHGDFWFPAAAFLGGAAIGSIIANQPRTTVRVSSAHVEWCYNRYKTYRASDNTFQPYNGPRRQCLSPYS